MIPKFFHGYLEHEVSLNLSLGHWVRFSVYIYLTWQLWAMSVLYIRSKDGDKGHKRKDPSQSSQAVMWCNSASGAHYLKVSHLSWLSDWFGASTFAISLARFGPHSRLAECLRRLSLGCPMVSQLPVLSAAPQRCKAHRHCLTPGSTSFGPESCCKSKDLMRSGPNMYPVTPFPDKKKETLDT